jgi:hypothetical protein
MEEGRSESGIDWGFEVESIIIEIIGDASTIRQDLLIDLLLQREELQSLYADFAEFLQRGPELALKYGKPNPLQNRTIKDELESLIYDLSTGIFHVAASFPNNERKGLQKLTRHTKIVENEEQIFISLIGEEKKYV